MVLKDYLKTLFTVKNIRNFILMTIGLAVFGLILTAIAAFIWEGREAFPGYEFEWEGRAPPLMIPREGFIMPFALTTFYPLFVLIGVILINKVLHQQGSISISIVWILIALIIGGTIFPDTYPQQILCSLFFPFLGLVGFYFKRIIPSSSDYHMERKIVSALLLLSCIYSAYVLIYVVWWQVEYYIELHQITIEYMLPSIKPIENYWVPILASIISIIILTKGIIASLKRKSWWWVFIASVFTLVVPVIYEFMINIYQTIPKNRARGNRGK
jgi:hypothetical protein